MKRHLVVLFVMALSLSGFAQAQCAAFPCVVATVTLTNQIQAIPSTPIFTPTASGIFRISAYMSTTANTNNGYVSVFVGWTDDFGVRKSLSTANANYSNSSLATSVVQDVGGQPLLYQTKPHGTGLTYNLFITVEQLQ